MIPSDLRAATEGQLRTSALELSKRIESLETMSIGYDIDEEIAMHKRTVTRIVNELRRRRHAE